MALLILKAACLGISLGKDKVIFRYIGGNGRFFHWSCLPALIQYRNLIRIPNVNESYILIERVILSAVSFIGFRSTGIIEELSKYEFDPKTDLPGLLFNEQNLCPCENFVKAMKVDSQLGRVWKMEYGGQNRFFDPKHN